MSSCFTWLIAQGAKERGRVQRFGHSTLNPQAPLAPLRWGHRINTCSGIVGNQINKYKPFLPHPVCDISLASVPSTSHSYRTSCLFWPLCDDVRPLELLRSSVDLLWRTGRERLTYTAGSLLSRHVYIIQTCLPAESNSESVVREHPSPCNGLQTSPVALGGQILYLSDCMCVCVSVCICYRNNLGNT